ncbi:MAG: HD domain-containing protein [Hyphomicrobiaceae bacterium]|nr:HD domain-containing protein [Hyphomicrobiaceae bacterium]
MTFLFLSDDPKRSEPAAKRLGQWLPMRLMALEDYCPSRVHALSPVVIDIDLTSQDGIKLFRDRFRSEERALAKVFLIRGTSRAEPYQADALGAALTIPALPRRAEAVKLITMRAQAQGTGIRGIDPEVPEFVISATEEVSSLHDIFYETVASGQPLPRAQVISASELLAESLKESSIAQWLEAVKQHNSYTYRHCMTVSGLAAAFTMHLGFGESDVQRISIGALMHDVGKVKMPISLLDKPGKLTSAEIAQIRTHAAHGAEILLDDAHFSDEVVDIARHHHELLDGSGYPDGISGRAISDPVRIMTIVDIFSALIDKRSYKDAMSAKQAYDILLDMEGKLEFALVRAFEPVALAAQSVKRNVELQAAVA